MSDPPSALVDAEEAGAFLSVPPTWVLKQARLKQIPHVRLGMYVRFNLEHLDAWWRKREEGPLHMIEDQSGRAQKGSPQ